MAVHSAKRTYGVNQAFRFVEDIWLTLQSRQIRFFSRKIPFHIIRAQRVLSNHLILKPWYVENQWAESEITCESDFLYWISRFLRLYYSSSGVGLIHYVGTLFYY